MQPLEICHIRDDDAQQVVKLAGHEVALHDLGDVLHRILKGGKLAFFLTMQPDVHEDVARQACLCLADSGRSFRILPVNERA